MAGYTRQSAASIINGENITAPPLNAEFNAIATAFADATGHAHDGTTGQGPKIDLTTSITGYLPAAHGGNAGKNNYAATSNPGVGDDINDGYNVGSVWYNVPDDRYWVCMYSAAGAAVWLENRFVNTNNDIAPHATDTVDLGSTLKRFKDLFLSGNADIDGTINVASTAYFGGTLSVQGNTTLNGDVTLGNSATDDINVTARFADDLIPSADDSRDLGSSTLQWRDLHLDGTANIDILDVHENAAVAGNTTLTGTLGVTGDTTVANLTSTGTSTHATVDINGGSIDGVDIGSNSVGTGAFSTITASGNITGNLVGNVTGNVSGVITGNVTGNVTSSGTSSFTTIAVSGGTVNGAVIGGSSPAAITGTTITSNNGFTGDLTGDVTGNLTGNVTGNVTATTGDTTLNNLTVNGTVDVTSANIVNVLDPTSAQHAATKNYVDVQVSNLVASAPGTLDTLNELAAALGDDPNFSTTVTNSIATKLPLAGGTMSGNLNMGSQNITNLNTPVNASDAATKGYIDTTFGSTSAAATSATNAANSATAAASSATDAANSYDSFDDRYLGAKNDLATRTTDNDGDALVTGALAFDTVNNVMKVWDGSDFVAASSSIDGIKNSFRYTATAGQTVFSGSDANSQTLVIDQAGLVNVFLNGVRLIQGSGQDYTVSAANNTVTLLSGAAVNDVIEIEVFGNFAGTAATSVNIGGGSVTGLTSLGVSGGNATFGDNDQAIFGADSDLTIVHNGSASFITNTTGNLTIRNTADDADVDIVSDDGSGGTAVYFRADGSAGQAKLYHNDSGTSTLRLNTSSDGIDITGHADIEGHFTATDGCTITTADNSTQLTLTSTDADSSEGPRLDLRRDSASPADGDLIGTIRYLGDDDAGTTTVFGEIQLEADAIADGSESGQMRLMIRNAGNLRNAVVIDATEVLFNQSNDDVDFRVESDTNTHALFVQGSSGNVGINENSPVAALHINDIGTTGPAVYIAGASGDEGDITVPHTESFQLGHWNSSTNTFSERMRVHDNGTFSFGSTSSKTKALFSGSSGTGSNLGDSDTLIGQLNQGFITVENLEDTAGVEAGIIFRAKTNLAGAWANYVKQNGNYTGDLIWRARSGGSTSAERMKLDTSGTLSVDSLNLTRTTDLSLSSTPALIIGSSGGANLAMDTNELSARNNGAGAELLLNHDTGQSPVRINSSLYLTGTKISTTSSTLDFSVDDDGNGSNQQIRFSEGGVVRMVLEDNDLYVSDNISAGRKYESGGGNEVYDTSSSQIAAYVGSAADGSGSKYTTFIRAYNTTDPDVSLFQAYSADVAADTGTSDNYNEQSVAHVLDNGGRIWSWSAHYAGRVRVGSTATTTAYRAADTSITAYSGTGNAHGHNTYAGYTQIAGRESANTDNVFLVNAAGSDRIEFDANGNGYFDGGADMGNADYAEYFEWADGNPNNEDRRGYPVALTTDGKIKIATADDDASDFLGIVSVEAAIVGDAAWSHWTGMHERDRFGQQVYEDYELLCWGPYDEDTKSYKTQTTRQAMIDAGREADIPEDAITVTKKRLKLAADYDPDREYIPRKDRQEWVAIGLMGKLPLLKGQPTATNWKKLFDLNDEVEMWLVR